MAIQALRRLPFLTLLLSVVLQPLPAQDATVRRRQPEPPDWQQQVDQVFGKALDVGLALPFYDTAGLLGLDVSPHRLPGEDGRPAAKALVLAESRDIDVRYAAFSGDGRRVLAADQDHAIHVFSLFRANWRLRSADAPDPQLAVLRGHTGAIVAFDTFPDGQMPFTDDFYRRAEILSASQDGTARIWRLCTPEEEARGKLATAPAGKVERQARAVLEHGEPLTAACYSASGRWIATGAADGSVIVWDENCQRRATISQQRQGRAAGSDPQQGPVQTLQFHGDDVLTVRRVGSQARHYRPDGSPAEAPPAAPPGGPAAAHTANEVTIQGNTARLALHDGTGLPLLGHTEPIRGSVLAADGTRALTYGDDGTVRVWEWLVRGPTGGIAAVSAPFVVLWLVAAAVLFTVFFRFVNFRLFKHAIQCVMGRFSAPGDPGELSHFQALSTALSATVGLGNIAGVAIAVMIGGPGATFWMIVSGLLGMTLKFTECTLGQKFRVIDEHGAVSGGPMHYLKDGLAQQWPLLAFLGAPLAVLFSLFCIGGSVAGGNAFQVNQSLGMLRGQVAFFDHYPWAYGLLMAFFTGIVIIGGIRSIARVADKIVPLMCGLYVLSSLVVILMHLEDVPQAFGRIFDSALSGDAVYGGVVGALIMGFRRASFSNEAGIGSASIAHSAARTPYPVREGIVALLEPFIDTVIVCTMTALVIGITGVYNAPEHAEIVASTNGSALTAEAFKTVGAMRDWFPWLLMIAVALFAYSTMISWSYYGERCATNLFGPRASLPFKVVFLAFTVLGSVVTAENILQFGDLMILLMAFPNIIGLYLLGGVVRRELKDYEARMAAGEIRPYR